eukprot:TRINITY_DN11956_c0_g1_i1.p1 TRINITY_DN11956_c0_g1~~TRINITY_DN11956_c0_g1_i1.p1  ORF type:complete len:103 (-),score=10.90 TRINITY_DN11956_c0_g1_i1:328-636(-)
MLRGNITDLHLDNNLIAQIANLPRTLRTLQCKHNKHPFNFTFRIKEIGNIGCQAPYIEVLDLTGNDVSSLDGVENLICLDTLILRANKVCAVSELDAEVKVL